MNTSKLLLLLLFLIITMPIASILNLDWNPDTLLAPPETLFELKPGNLFFYFSYFLSGVLLYSNQKFFIQLRKIKILIPIIFLSMTAFLFQLIESTNPTAFHTLLRGQSVRQGLCWKRWIPARGGRISCWKSPIPRLSEWNFGWSNGWVIKRKCRTNYST